MNSLLIISFLNELELISLHTSMAVVSIKLNAFNYCYLTQIILFNINHSLHTVKWLQVLLFNFILFNITHSFAYS